MRTNLKRTFTDPSKVDMEHETLVWTTRDTKHTPYVQCDTTGQYNKCNRRHYDIAIPYRDSENIIRNNEKDQLRRARAKGMTCTRRAMMREANAQEEKANACEVKVSFNREGMCSRYSALTKTAFMRD